MPGFQPSIVPSSVENRNTAGAVVLTPFLSGPVTLKAPFPLPKLNTVPVGVPPVVPTGVGMVTTSGTIVTGVLLAPGT